MIYGFQKGTFYNYDLDPDCYILCVHAKQFLTYWQVWAVFYNRSNNALVKEHKRWFVDKTNLGSWHYGANGPN